MFDVQYIRSDFPILKQQVDGKPLVYLDNAATTHKPRVVLNTIQDFYTQANSNIHRGVHSLSEQATNMYEESRRCTAEFLNAEKACEVIFTHGTTDSINLIADTFGQKYVRPGDEIVISEMEHHSNLIPWQLLCQRSQAVLKVVPMDKDGRLCLEAYDQLLTDKTRLVALTYVSNVLGVVNPAKQMISLAHERSIPVLVDAAQAVQHIPIDVKDLDCDFLAFSGHKIYAETGIGVLYAKEKWLRDLPPYQSGGGMIKTVSFDKAQFETPPLKFEAGTPNISGALSLAAALNYVSELGPDQIMSHEKKLIKTALERLSGLEAVTVYAPTVERCSVVSFNVEGLSSYDTGVLLNKMGVAVRTGTHCAEPLARHFHTSGMVRASFAVYNTLEEIEILIAALKKVCLMAKV